MADLTVTQLMQESVLETERGVVNGVQQSLNMFMDMLKFTLVIVVPHVRHFGYLVLASYAFIAAAGSLFAYHSWKVRGHLFHCCRSPPRGGAANGGDAAAAAAAAENSGPEAVELKPV